MIPIRRRSIALRTGARGPAIPWLMRNGISAGPVGWVDCRKSTFPHQPRQCRRAEQPQGRGAIGFSWGPLYFYERRQAIAHGVFDSSHLAAGRRIPLALLGVQAVQHLLVGWPKRRKVF